MQSVAAAVCAVPVLLLAWRLGGTYLDRYFTRKLTVLCELDDIGNPRPDNKRIQGTAVICGGSIAGLWTARIAADHFEDVAVVEPEPWLATEEGQSNTFDADGTPIESRRENIRTRVMQYTSVHIFQPLALLALRKLFPNVDEEVKNADGRIAAYEVNGHAFGRPIMKIPMHEYPDGNYPECLFMTRELYERLLRRLVTQSSKRIRWVVGTATGINTVPGDPTTLSSVTIRTPEGNGEKIPAALVIDCTGGTQAGLKWLRRIAADTVNTETLQKCAPAGALSWDDVKIEYSTAQPYIVYRFYVPPEARAKLPIPGGYENNIWPYMYMPVPGVERKIFMMNRIEGHRFNIAFCGWGAPPMPMDFDSIKDWFKNFSIDHQKIPEWILPLLDILLEYKDQCEILTGKYSDPSWLRFERAPYVPSNFIAIGDAVMRVNPVFGQGCSKATIGALALDGFLKSSSYANLTTIPAGFGREFFKMHKNKIESIWDGTKPTDYMWDTTRPVKGEKHSDEWLNGVLGNIVMDLAGRDPEVDAALFKVRFFLGPSTALLAPHLLVKIIAFAVRQKLGLVPA
ncbi:hypothetical protein EW145_g4086 [Phellinidium pouzarii]|uniref:FAD-binding domain-containing protein n=1 Tax=Phellinidium pouzarii TaxID=167371 RepID=A0A4V3XCM7_9AGAM|nr:hypothetical protein EW145_g4086 [Phellinidium pouzarii]